MKNFFYFFIIFIVYLSIASENTSIVFNEVEDDLNSYYLEIENLNTNNISCIENLNIQALEIDINNVYKMDRLFFYKNLNFFINNVIKRLKEKGYYMEANKYLIEPIKIKKVLVFNNKTKVIEILESCKLNYQITIKST